ncbi:HAD-IA family hydrolase [Fulvivirga lutea]|uniref:HAD-IA family hydrolase n=1 Tax=Fulvivirga lutea TaxID=2810512 RepID=A0A974WEG0_9BACT|nr:HAD-IA family hydrolase [Fulvivirga lutea]QSE96094.1 HAD-IA family hydrolase [Fulvivirga lutea]
MPDKLKNIETIIFDFDGTIADTLELGIKISNQLSHKFRYKQIADKQDLDFYRNLSTQNAIKAIGISLVKLPFVASAFRKSLSKSIDQLHPFEGMVEVIKDLAENYKLGIVTSNSLQNTKTFLDNHGLTESFSYYSTGIRLFKKYRTINALIKEYELDPRQILLIGDETRDIEAAQQCGLPIVSVTWGFHTKKVLSSFHPDYLVDTPQELSALLTANN